MIWANAMSKLLPLVSQLGTYVKMGMDHYADLRAAGKDASPDIVAMFLAARMDSWDPKVGNKRLLDPETKQAAARFIAGVAVNFASA